MPKSDIASSINIKYKSPFENIIPTMHKVSTEMTTKISSINDFVKILFFIQRLIIKYLLKILKLYQRFKILYEFIDFNIQLITIVNMLTNYDLERLTLGYLVKSIHQIIDKKLNGILSFKKISPQQGRCIVFLYENKGKDINQKDIENAFNSTKGAVSGVLKRLLEKGYIKKIKPSKDSRKNYIALTSEGEEIFKEIHHAMMQVEAEIKSKLGKEAHNALLKDLYKTLEVINND